MVRLTSERASTTAVVLGSPEEAGGVARSVTGFVASRPSVTEPSAPVVGWLEVQHSALSTMLPVGPPGQRGTLEALDVSASTCVPGTGFPLGSMTVTRALLTGNTTSCVRSEGRLTEKLFPFGYCG